MKKVTNDKKFSGEFNSMFMESPFFEMIDNQGNKYIAVNQYKELIEKQVRNGYNPNQYGQRVLAFADSESLSFIIEENGEFNKPLLDQESISNAYTELKSKLFI